MSKNKINFNLVMVYITIIVSIFAFGLMIAGALLLNTDVTDKQYIINMSIDAYSLVIAIVLMFGIAKDMTITHKIDRFLILFFLFLPVNFIAAFADFFTWLLQGNDNYVTINKLSNFIFYLTGPTATYVYWKYIKNIYSPNNKGFDIFQTMVYSCAIISIILNLKFGFYYTINDNGEYVRNQNTFYYKVIPNLIMNTVSIFIIIRGSKKNKIDKLVYILYCVFPFSISIIQFFFFEIDILFPINICFIIAMYNGIHSERQRENMINKMKIIQSQLQPHFIYNSMISIRRLIKKSPENAIKTMDNFMDFLRNTIDNYAIEGAVKIENEIKFLKNYLEIEKVRFGEKIQYEIEYDEVSFEIPAMSIQLFVENAIRHGIRQREDGQGRVFIEIYSDKKNHHINIEDDGVGFDIKELDKDGKNHVGLTSVINRIEYISNGKVIIDSKPGVGTKVHICI